MDLKEAPIPPPAAGATASAAGGLLAAVFAHYPLEVASAHGVWLTNTRGERVLDLYGGHAVAALGYGHPAWTAALERQEQPVPGSPEDEGPGGPVPKPSQDHDYHQIQQRAPGAAAVAT